MPAKLRAILLDLDDTVTDRQASVSSYAERFRLAFRDRLAPSEDELSAALAKADGRGYNVNRARDIVAALSWHVPPTPEQVDEHWRTHFPDCVIPRAGLSTLLAEAGALRLRLGLVTNGGTDAQLRKLNTLKLSQRFASVAISESAGVSKPDPAIFRLVLRALDVPPEACFFIGDHPERDIEAARSLGMLTAWVSNGLAWPEGREPPDLVLDSLAEPSLIDSLRRLAGA